MSSERIVAGVSTGMERRLAETFVELANTLVADFEAVDFLSMLTGRCMELLDVDAVGVLVSNQRGRLQVMAASSEKTRLLELFQLQNEEGPCFDCVETGQPTGAADLLKAGDRWPIFTPQARAVGFAAVLALPMRLRNKVIGALNLFHRTPRTLSDDARSVAQALADVATIGLLHERAIRDRDLVAEQLQAALNSRIVIEQAKGLLSERRQISVDEAFSELRRFSRSRNRKMSEIARAVVERSPDVADLIDRPDRSAEGV